MSTQALGAFTPAGELAAGERIRQIETMIEQAQQGATATSAGGFSDALAAAEAPSQDASDADMASTAQAGSTLGSDSAGAAPYEAAIDQAAERNGIEPALLHGLIQQESGFDASAQSSAGAMGLTQLMPATASSLGVSDPMNPAESIEGGARYLGQLMSEFGGDTTDALAAYNAGPAAVGAAGGVPQNGETESYVEKVLADAPAYRQTEEQTL